MAEHITATRIIPARAGFTGFAGELGGEGGDHPRSRGVYAPSRRRAGRRSGSSPLARGLLVCADLEELADGIIPARAGFTSTGPCARRGRADHPRSRGVYDADMSEYIVLPGSSPLARGLLNRHHIVVTASGIIPARAGFTPRTSSWWPIRSGSSPLARGLHGVQCPFDRLSGIIPARAGFTAPMTPIEPCAQDHPRSRGVYGSGSSSKQWIQGSSPLARGLHLCRGSPVRRGGIIPARAGFTTRLRGIPTARRDHPRSRGVYGRQGAGYMTRFGSSPLARGLRTAIRVAAVIDGIIPARAGFTFKPGGLTAAQRDHPRSRGVYSSPQDPTSPHTGSSPLARGLLTHPLERTLRARIIPARAGFTTVWFEINRPVGDHPRSRGVYYSGQGANARAGGSSPLARGLLLVYGGFGDFSGIIPARAGFTAAGVSRPRLIRDHPRSRGVYPPAIWGGGRSEGSSPLARGLRGLRSGGRFRARIIPARAGFTAYLSGTGSGIEDHPRSRGVYRYDTAVPMIRNGSSPLARGLRLHSGPHVHPAGIIPARAGFTDLLDLWRGKLTDHPRSRGVYPRFSRSSTRTAGSSPLARGLQV